MDTKEYAVKRTLKSLGANPAFAGYTYLVEAITIAIDKPEATRHIVNDIYSGIAERHNSPIYNVERCIRYSIETSYAAAPLKVINEVFGNTVSISKRRPTNKQYIATVADYLRDTWQ